MNRLKELRKDKKITIRGLADKMKINRTTLSNIENENHTANSTQLISLSEQLGASIDYILGISDVRMIAREVRKSKAEQKDWIVEQVNKMEPQDISLVYFLIRGVLDSKND